MKALILLLTLAGGIPSFSEAVLLLSGASCTEELDEHTMERYDALRSSPVDINSASRSRLLSSGLFSSFQIASLVDYRMRTGDILSLSELAAVDGFSMEYAAALSYFVKLGTSSPPGTRPSGYISHGLHGKARCSTSASPAFSAASRYSISVRDAVECSVASSGNFSVAVHPAGFPATFLVGDYNVRFGQGLALWSGFSMSGFPTVSSFRRNGSGFSAVKGYADSGHRGAAAVLDFGRWSVGACVSLPGLRSIMTGGKSAVSCLPAVYVSYMARRLSSGLSAHSFFAQGYSSHTVSADFRLALHSASIFGEAAGNWRTDVGTLSGAFCTGLLWTPSYGKSFSVLARYYSPSYHGLYAAPPSSYSGGSDEAGLSAGLSLPWLGCTADFSFRPSDRSGQLKTVCTVARVFSAWGFLQVTPSLRAVARYRPSESDRVRADLRADLTLLLSDWSACARYNTVLYVSRSWLWYAELGWKKNYLRFTLFKVDDWSDRIYAYERSAPGTFSVPAFYGRGYRLSLYSSWKAGKSHAFHFCASYTAYPWMQVPKDARLNIQIDYTLSIRSRGK